MALYRLSCGVFVVPALVMVGCSNDEVLLVNPVPVASGIGTGGSAIGSGGSSGSVGGSSVATGGASAGKGGAGGSATVGTGGASGSAGKAATGGVGGTGGGNAGGFGGFAGSATFGGMGGGTSGKKFCDLPGGPAADLTVPDGFCIRRFAGPKVVTVPRTIRIAPNGDVFIGSPATSTYGGAFGGLGAIVVLPDDNHDGVADKATIYMGGGSTTSGSCDTHDADPNDFTCGHGIAFIDGYLYLTRYNDVRRVPYTVGDRQAATAPELVATLGLEQPADWRFTHTLDRAANGDVLVSRGRFDSPDCSDASVAEGAVLRIPVAGGVPATPQVLAHGFRNPMYVRCHPTSGACFANELSGDGWDGSIGGREKLVLLEDGTNYGYPCCVTKDKPADPTVPISTCATVSAELVAMTLHDTPFGLDFNRGSFPGQYKNALFIANHGAVSSWIGTQVVWYPTDPVSKLPLPQPDPQAPPNPFVTGFGHGPGTVNGRATDVAFSPDGRMFIIDDSSNQVWWVAPVDLESPAGWLRPAPCIRHLER